MDEKKIIALIQSAIKETQNSLRKGQKSKQKAPKKTPVLTGERLKELITNSLSELRKASFTKEAFLSRKLMSFWDCIPEGHKKTITGRRGSAYLMISDEAYNTLQGIIG